MMFSFLIVSFFLGLFMSIIWSSNQIQNVLIKAIWITYTLSAFLLIAQLAQERGYFGSMVLF
jgi:hypothetical protein